MNTFIETLNLWGDRFLDFVWPMLWQSSLLILALFALDFVLRKRVRAAIRYALWLVVLVKLVVPPAFASPTGLAWWLRSNQPPHRPAPAKSSIVIYPETTTQPLPPLIETEGSTLAPRLSGLSGAAWALIGFELGNAALLSWLLIRWLQVARHVRQAMPASDKLYQSLMEAKHLAGLRQSVRLCLTPRALSPAVCGLFRPVVLLPQSLVENLPVNQLRAVLLHELIHLRRADVWVNCAQTLLQIAYWWHPLLWLANARIRRVREEAVDDAVMLALRDDAEIYAPTLLEVANLALNRPLASLGLVGILESRSALRQRIERLVNFTTPTRAGLSILSGLGIAAFTAMAVPMGEAPVPPETAAAASSSREKIEAASADHGMPAANAIAQTVEPGGARDPLTPRFEQIQFDAISFAHVPLRNALSTLNDETRRHDPDRKGLNFVVDRNAERAGEQTIDPTTGLPLTTVGIIDSVTVNIDPPLTAVRLRTVLDAIVHGADKPIKYSIEDDRTVIFSLRTGKERAELHVRTYSVNLANLRNQMGSTGPVSPEEYHQALRKLFSNAGADLALPKSTLLNDRQGLLLVRATDDDLKTIDAVVAKLNGNPSPKANLRPTPGSPNPSGVNLVARTNLVFTEEARRAVLNKLDHIRFASVEYHNMPLPEVLGNLSEETRRRAQDQTGINFIIDPKTDAAAGEATIDPATGLPISAVDSSSILITIDPPLADVRVVDVLNAVLEGANKPLKYSIAADGTVVVSPRTGRVAPEYHIRTFKVDPAVFLANLREQTHLAPASSTQENLQALIKLFTAAGVDVQPAFNVFFKDREGTLLVRASADDLDVVEAIVQSLNYRAPEVNIKVKFVALTEEAGRVLGFGWLLENGMTTNMDPTASVPASMVSVSGTTFTTSSPAAFTGILTQPQYRVILGALQKRGGVDLLNESQVTMLSGRQAQISAVDLMTVVTNINPQALKPPGVSSTDNPNALLQTQTLPIGPTVDLLPTAGKDGRTIELTTIPTLVEFLGYKESTNATVYVDGEKQSVSVAAPRWRVRQLSSHDVVVDGQTLVLGNLPDIQGNSAGGPEQEKEQLLVFVTPTLVDSAGQRVNKDEGKPLQYDGIQIRDLQVGRK